MPRYKAKEANENLADAIHDCGVVKFGSISSYKILVLLWRESGSGSGSGFGYGSDTKSLLSSCTDAESGFCVFNQCAIRLKKISTSVHPSQATSTKCPSISCIISNHRKGKYTLKEKNIKVGDGKENGGLHSPWEFTRNSPSQGNLTMYHLKNRNNSGRQYFEPYFWRGSKHGSIREKVKVYDLWARKIGLDIRFTNNKKINWTHGVLSFFFGSYFLDFIFYM